MVIIERGLGNLCEYRRNGYLKTLSVANLRSVFAEEIRRSYDVLRFEDQCLFSFEEGAEPNQRKVVLSF